MAIKKESAYIAASNAAARGIDHILETAAGRDLTANQRSGIADYQRAIAGAFDSRPSDHGSAYSRKLRENLDDPSEVSDVSIRTAVELAKVMSFEDLQEAGDKFRSAAAPVVEGPRGLKVNVDGQNLSIRELVRGAFEGRAIGFGSYISKREFEQRTLQSAGGSAIESTFADQVIRYQRTLSPLIDPNITRVIARTDGSPFIQPRLTADQAAGGTVTAESGGLTLLDPTVSAVTITPQKRGAITKITSELLEDNDIDLQQLVVESAGRAIGIALGTALTGTLLAGISNGGTASGTANGAASWTFFGPPDLAALYVSVAAPYRATGTWLVSTDAMAKLFQLRDGQNQPVLFHAASDGVPRLFGRPVIEDPGLAAVGSATKSVVFGDLRQAMTVVRRTPIDVLISREAYFGTDEVGVRVIDRSAGAVIDSVAAAYLVSANT